MKYARLIEATFHLDSLAQLHDRRSQPCKRCVALTRKKAKACRSSNCRKIHFGDKRLVAWIVANVAQQGINQETKHARVMRVERNFQPFERFVRFTANSVNLCDLIGQFIATGCNQFG
jgi:hypothetical protein